MVCIYTSAGGTSRVERPAFTQSIAYSNDCGRTWTKYEKNPVLKHIIGGNRDPKVFWHAADEAVGHGPLPGRRHVRPVRLAEPEAVDEAQRRAAARLGRVPRHLRTARRWRRGEDANGSSGAATTTT